MFDLIRDFSKQFTLGVVFTKSKSCLIKLHECFLIEFMCFRIRVKLWCIVRVPLSSLSCPYLGARSSPSPLCRYVAPRLLIATPLNSSYGQVVRASASGAIYSSLIPSRARPMAIIASQLLCLTLMDSRRSNRQVYL